MKTRIVLAGLMATMMVLEVSAQREYDDMYFRGKDREKNKAIEADEAFTPVKKKKQTSAEEAMDEDYYANPTDSYSARNVNPEYVSRSNSEQASDDEASYYSEDYQPATPDYNYNNSYYNNANWARNSFYANSMWNRPFYGGMGMGYGGMGFYDPWMSPYGGFGYDPWMSPMYGYGMGPGYGWGNRWSISFGYGNYWGPSYGYGFNNGFGYPYYGYGGYGYPNYYYGGGGYYESGRGVNYGKRPSRHSATVQPTQQNRTRQQVADNNNTVNNSRSRTRETQGEYYVRPSRRTSTFDNTTNPTRSNSSGNVSPGTQPSRSRDWSQPRESRPSYTPSSSPSRSNSGGSSSGGSRGSSGGGGGGGSRPRGRG